MGKSQQAIPVAREEAVVRKRAVETGRVRVRTRMQSRAETLTGALQSREVEIERVPIGREVDGPLPPRREGDAWIVPIVEEVLVVEKRWRLKEELHVRPRTVERPYRKQVTLRSEQASVERTAPTGRKR
jgi:uncharacterized protein (TIGR02271 family)